MLETRGLKVNPDSRYEFADAPEGTVIRQSPSAGAMVKKGDTVTLTISKGVEQVQVPDIKKCTEAEAAERLRANRLEPGSADSEYDDTIPEGSIISQTPESGSSVSVGSQVDYVVSLGKKEIIYRMEDRRIEEPQGSEMVISANISLLDANGTEIARWDGIPISSFPYVISTKKDITTSTGTIEIEWVLDDGDSQTQQESIRFLQK